MSRSLRRGGTAAIVLTLAAISLSACSAGNSAETLQVKPDSPATSLGNLKLNNILVIVDPAQTSGRPGPANVIVNISNTGFAPETLQSVTVASGTATFADPSGAPLAGGIVIPAGGAVALGGNGQPSAHLAAVSLQVGGFEPAAFAFAVSGKVNTLAQVNPATGDYASFAPSNPSAGASSSTSASSSASGAAPSGSASPSPAAAPSGSASASGSPSGSPAASGSPVGAASATASAGAH